MKAQRLTEQDLAQFEANMRRIKVGQPGPARAVADSQGAGLHSKVLTVTASPKRLYDSKWEADYHAKLKLEMHAGLIKEVWLHPFSLWLAPGVRYKPDFLVQYPLGMERSLQIVEVKGWSRNLRDGLTRLKIAAALFPCFEWTLAYKVKGGGWMEETL